MPQSYTPEFRRKIVRLHEEGRTHKSIEAEYNVSKASISKWCRVSSEECQNSPEALEEHEVRRENRKLRKELEEARKAGYYERKEEVQKKIIEIYHSHNGVDGYRIMAVYLERAGYRLSPATVHKYMNGDLGLRSVVRRRRSEYAHGKPHKVFDNLLGRDFRADMPNQKWCTDFTYLFLKGGEVRYNCTIIDLYDRSVVASVTDRDITSDLAIRTLWKALDAQRVADKGLILHSDPGSQ